MEEEKMQEINNDDNLNDYALGVVENYLNKLAERLEEKKQRTVIRETDSVLEDNQYTVTVLCYFSNDIEKIANKIITRDKWRVLEAKDYIDHPKKNGYRGYWIKLAIPAKENENENAVINIRIHTIGMEYWLEMEAQIEDSKKKKEQLQDYSKQILDMEDKIYKKKK